MSDFGKFVGGLMMGGAIGGLLGVLLAPRKGEETRQLIADSAGEARKKAECSLNDIQTKTDKAIEDLQKTGQEVLHKVADSVGPLEKKAEDQSHQEETHNESQETQENQQ